MKCHEGSAKDRGEHMVDRPLLLLTNDDGLEAIGMRLLVQSLHAIDAFDIVVVAPRRNQSATGMRLNLMTPLPLRRRNDLIDTWNLKHPDRINLFDLDGTPCDCMIVALDGGLDFLIEGGRPTMVVSGVNLGPNMSQDCLHSGTMGAARESSMYGVPSIASSLTVFEDTDMQVAVDATVQAILQILPTLPLQARNLGRNEHNPQPWHWGGTSVIENDMLKEAFYDGDLYLNLNIPPDWNGQWKTTRFGIRWYRNAVAFDGNENESNATFTIGASKIEKTDVERGDCDAVELSFASISSLGTWPQNHPLSLSEHTLTYAYEVHHEFPDWIMSMD